MKNWQKWGINWKIENMFKSFKVMVGSSEGNGHYKSNYLEELDEMINNHANKNGLKVNKVDYSLVNDIVYGGYITSEIKSRSFLIAGVSFKK